LPGNIHKCAFLATRRPSWLKVPLNGLTRKKASALSSRKNGSNDVFVHISAVEAAGMRTLNEGQKVAFDIVTERGKSAAANLQIAA